jgi:phosphonopyruvate decarboxylase
MPILLLVTLRGEAGFSDEPQHRVMGAITFDLLKDMRIPFEVMEDDKEKLIDQLENINKKTKLNSHPMALVIRKGTISSYQLKDYEKTPNKYFLSRKKAIQIIVSCLSDNEAVISTTGKISRELFFENKAREGNFYMVGSMGCASAIAFGLAMEKPKKRIIVLDGDGAFLMKMGNTATIGYYKPANYVYIVLDNESHDSTGGQFTVSSKINFSGVASSCGFKNTVKVSTETELREELKKIALGEGPHFIHVKVLKGADKNLGRPTLDPSKNKNQFSAFIRK